MKVQKQSWFFSSVGAVALLSISNACIVNAQTASEAAVMNEFPANALALNKQELDARLRGQVYVGATSSGIGWRVDYKDSGYMFVDMDNGASDSGTWRTEDGKVCVEYRKAFPSGCSEVRGSADALYSKRDDGKIVTVMRKK